MIDTAKDYDVRATLSLPSLSSEGISIAFTSTVDTTLDSQRELTSIDTLQQNRQVRNVLRESRTKASQLLLKVNDNDFWIYRAKTKVVRKVYTEVWIGKKLHKKFETVPLQHPDAHVAFAKHPFGEGAERLVYRFYEIASDRKTILGKAMVAKESRFVTASGFGDIGDKNEREIFAKTFFKTQQLARRLAIEYKEKMKTIPLRIDLLLTPQIHFLDCWIYELNDDILGKYTVLVEEKLDHNQWQKWNDNAGNIYHHHHNPTITTSSNEIQQVEVTSPNTMNNNSSSSSFRLIANGFSNVQRDLDILEEGSEEEEESDDDDHDYYIRNASTSFTRNKPEIFSPSTVAQSFSHFTYQASGKKRLVCDLQGVYNVKHNILMLSDPVKHYYNPNRTNKKRVHGNTDRGLKGFTSFFDTHRNEHCGILCQLMIRGFKKKKNNNNNRNHQLLLSTKVNHENLSCIVIGGEQENAKIVTTDRNPILNGTTNHQKKSIIQNHQSLHHNNNIFNNNNKDIPNRKRIVRNRSTSSSTAAATANKSNNTNDYMIGLRKHTTNLYNDIVKNMSNLKLD